jgi:UDP-galactopyranose mutase
MDIVCFSHLRWNFVFQRPQHLMSRFAKAGRVFVIEEPIYEAEQLSIQVDEASPNVFVCVPHLPKGAEQDTHSELVISLIDELIADHKIENYVTWFYTPMMLEWSRDLSPLAVVYDCMDQLSAFKNAPVELQERERELFDRADLVFTGGRSLYEAKREQHTAVYAFPSSIDKTHFGQARSITEDFDAQSAIKHPRVGFVGVIDERADLELLAAVADLRPDMNFLMVGPVVKIGEDSLPRRSNIHYLGQKSYDELPAILAGWDVAMMPFALNESTRYISPTKTPEYLAAGLPVVSTPIADVVDPYGKLGLVRIASTAEEFAKAIDAALNDDVDERIAKADLFLKNLSWDDTFRNMSDLIAGSIGRKSTRPATAGI